MGLAPARSRALGEAPGAGLASGAASARTDEIHRRGVDLRRVPLVAILVFPLAGLDAAFDLHRPALREILMAQLAYASPSDDAVPLGALDPFAVLVVPGLACRQCEIADGLAVLGLSKFRIPAEVADENGFVDACHAERSIGTGWMWG